MNKHYLFEQAEGAIILDGFDDCLIGIAEEFGNGPRLIYSKDRIIHKLREDMTEEEAYEYYDYNILGGYFGEQGPVFYLNP
jgi:hypothetical protein